VQLRGGPPLSSDEGRRSEETMMSRDSSEKPSVNRWATGIRMATVIVVLGTLAAV